MLLPRRKSQLLKFLLLLPLSVLLITSIYYQYRSAQPTTTRPLVYDLTSSAALSASSNYRSKIINRPHAQRYKYGLNDDIDDSSVRNDAAAIMPELVQVEPQNNSVDSSEIKRNNHRNSQRHPNNDNNNENTDSNNNDNIYNINNLDDNESDSSSDDSGISVQGTGEAAAPAVVRSHKHNHSDGDDVDNGPLSRPDVGRRPALAAGGSRRAELASRVANIKRNKLSNDIAGVDNNNNNDSDKERPSEQDEQQNAAVIPAPNESTGLGELGRPVILKNLTKEQQDMVNVGWENNAFNQYISDLISLNRSLPDVRDPSCKPVEYPIDELPPTDVIICFHNEAWSVLLRTIHSILNRSPARLVNQIILVDDYSNKPHLGKQLENYVATLTTADGRRNVVKIVRAKRREGLIRARLLGAEAATAPVLTFLDSHCECADGWLEPLLARIHQDHTTVVCPVIDVISDKTFEYHYRGDADAINVGGFDWNLQFNWHSVPEREKKRRKHSYDPVRSPTMAGGLFSISKEFFERLGTYDSGFDIWGGENLELSFKTWMCGGTLEIIPCSHVGHIFRSRSPYKWRTGVNVLKRNSVRLAEVWMDEYKKYYYDRIGHDLGDYGDVSERKQLRDRLHCKSFSYFVKEVYPELFIPGEAIAYGEVRNEAGGEINMCLDSPARKADMHKSLGVYPCHGAGGNQYWLLSKEGEIRRDEACVDYAGRDVILFPCHGSGGNQLWWYDHDLRQIKHSTSGRCLELARDRIKLAMSECDPSNDAQRWKFQHFNQTHSTQHTRQELSTSVSLYHNVRL
ncbi:putative polypeptide N-acetylgalactosaminyltransferase 9, partial [Fragariocoptes setiger]